MVTLDASLSTDPDNDPLTYEWDLDNDGQYNDATGITAQVSFPDDGQYIVVVRVTDPSGAQSTDSAIVNVLNIAPSIVEPINIIAIPVLAKTSIAASAAFKDPGVLDTHTALWDWGDGSISAGTVAEINGSGSVTGSHTYTYAGVYTVKVTDTDDDGDSGNSIFQFIVIYDPNGGYVTGVGWINSPAGAYMPNSALTGKATFGFVSKYQKGANVPTGNTEFQFHVANMNFKSTSYDWLVIAGSKAQYKGTGTINGAGEYKFMLTAIDGTPDKLRIKIWGKASGQVVYDNMIGTADDAIPTTVLGGGSIVIHK